MNETMSLVLATLLLATGGVGLYMFKLSRDDDTVRGERDQDEYSEPDTNEDTNEGLFSFGNFWSLGNDVDEDEQRDRDDTVEENVVKTRRNHQNKTKRTNKKSGGSKRRY